jgi:hypothetical protein
MQARVLKTFLAEGICLAQPQQFYQDLGKKTTRGGGKSFAAARVVVLEKQKAAQTVCVMTKTKVMASC